MTEADAFMAITEAEETVDHPGHYTALPVEPIELARVCDFCTGNVLKYILRAPFKGTAMEDMKKAYQLKATDFSDALAFVNTCGLSEIPGRKPLVFSAIEAENLQGALYHLRYIHRDSFVAFYKFLVATRSPLAPQVYEALNDLHLRGVERVMERQGYGYKDLEAI